MTTNSSPEYVLESANKSFQRLGVDHIDLYYMHRANEAVPIEKTVGAMKQLVTYVATHNLSVLYRRRLTARDIERAR